MQVFKQKKAWQLPTSLEASRRAPDESARSARCEFPLSAGKRQSAYIGPACFYGRLNKKKPGSYLLSREEQYHRRRRA